MKTQTLHVYSVAHKSVSVKARVQVYRSILSLIKKYMVHCIVTAPATTTQTDILKKTASCTATPTCQSVPNIVIIRRSNHTVYTLTIEHLIELSWGCTFNEVGYNSYLK